MTDSLTFTDPTGHPVSEQEVRRLYAQQVPWAVEALCHASNTPVPSFAQSRPPEPVQLTLDLVPPTGD